MQTTALSNIQLELLKTYARPISDEDVLAIQELLAKYFAKKAIDIANKVWDNNQWQTDDTIKLSQEHNRKKQKS